MVNNIKRKKIYYDKDMKREQIVSEFVAILSIMISLVTFINTFFHIVTTMFVVATILIIALTYLGCKIDEIRGYE